MDHISNNMKTFDTIMGNMRQERKEYVETGFDTRLETLGMTLIGKIEREKDQRKKENNRRKDKNVKNIRRYLEKEVQDQDLELIVHLGEKNEKGYWRKYN